MAFIRDGRGFVEIRDDKRLWCKIHPEREVLEIVSRGIVKTVLLRDLGLGYVGDAVSVRLRTTDGRIEAEIADPEGWRLVPLVSMEPTEHDTPVAGCKLVVLEAHFEDGRRFSYVKVVPRQPHIKAVASLHIEK